MPKTKSNLISKKRKMKGNGPNALKDGDLVILTYSISKNDNNTFKINHMPLMNEDTNEISSYDITFDNSEVSYNSLWIYRKQQIEKLTKQQRTYTARGTRYQSQSAINDIQNKKTPRAASLQIIYENLEKEYFEIYANANNTKKFYLKFDTGKLGYTDVMDTNIYTMVSHPDKNKSFISLICRDSEGILKKCESPVVNKVQINIIPFRTLQYNDNILEQLRTYQIENITKLNQYEYQIFYNKYTNSTNVLELKLLKVENINQKLPEIMERNKAIEESRKTQSVFTRLNPLSSNKKQQKKLKNYNYVLCFDANTNTNIKFRQNILNTEVFTNNNKNVNCLGITKEEIIMNKSFLIGITEKNGIDIELIDKIESYFTEEDRDKEQSTKKVYRIIDNSKVNYDKYYFEIDDQNRLYILKNNIHYYLCLKDFTNICLSNVINDSIKPLYIISKETTGGGETSHKLIKNKSSIDIYLGLKSDNPHNLLPLINQYLVKNDLLCSCTI